MVIDGQTPELAEAGAAAPDRPAGRRQIPVSRDVRRPDGGAFFDQNGLLFLSAEGGAEPPPSNCSRPSPSWARWPPIRRCAASWTAFRRRFWACRRARPSLSDLDVPMARFGQSLRPPRREGRERLSVLALADHRRAAPARRNPPLHRGQAARWISMRWSRAANASDRDPRRRARAGPDTGRMALRVRLTGDVPLSDEEFATLTDRAWLMAGAMMAGVLLTLWLALRSFKIIFAILVTLVVGLAHHHGPGPDLRSASSTSFPSPSSPCSWAWAWISASSSRCAIAPSVSTIPNSAKALCHTGRSVGMPLALAAAATAVGFFSFLPTNYIGRGGAGLCRRHRHDRGLPTVHHLAAGLADAARPEGEAEDVGFAVPGGGSTIIWRAIARPCCASPPAAGLIVRWR